MTCTKCKHDAEIARLREICTKCRLGEYVAGDGSVSLDAIIDGTEERFLDVAPGVSTVSTFDPADAIDGERPAASALPFSEETEEALLRLVHEFAQLPPVIAHVLHALLNRRTLRSVAREMGWSLQRLHHRVKVAVASFPTFAVVYRAVRDNRRRRRTQAI